MSNASSGAPEALILTAILTGQNAREQAARKAAADRETARLAEVDRRDRENDARRNRKD